MDPNWFLVALTTVYVITTIAIWRATAAQRRATDLQLARSGFIQVIDLMERCREDRAYVRLLHKNGKTHADLVDMDLRRVDNVCRVFDILGYYDRHRLIPQHFIDEFYAPTFIEIYESFLKSYVSSLREVTSRGPTHFWELVQFYERVKDVRKQHPALTNSENWPENPRSLLPTV